MEIGISEWQCGIQRNSKSNTSCVDSNLGPRFEGSGTSKDLPALRPRVEGRNETRNLTRREKRTSGWVEFCDFEPCLKTNFGASVNGTNGMNWSTDECPA
ncbi:hypothetical protein AVEN_198515-1 [Araneus ventricosus]|uniref:Uncharacterized protein n=1 Tax=Araneus ventricosus TaxID=182803 RepID=A0A4Y2JBZ5_ARAVE|nr:hypothetical protein AVEN_198515-1 [Araneus ventricosus]